MGSDEARVVINDNELAMEGRCHAHLCWRSTRILPRASRPIDRCPARTSQMGDLLQLQDGRSPCSPQFILASRFFRLAAGDWRLYSISSTIATMAIDECE